MKTKRKVHVIILGTIISAVLLLVLLLRGLTLTIHIGPTRSLWEIGDGAENAAMQLIAQIKNSRAEGKAVLKKGKYSIEVKESSWVLKAASRTKLKYIVAFTKGASSITDTTITLEPEITDFMIQLSPPITVVSPIGGAIDIEKIEMKGKDNISADVALAMNETIASFLGQIFCFSESDDSLSLQDNVEKIFSELTVDNLSFIVESGAKIKFSGHSLVLGEGNTLHLKDFSLRDSGKAKGALAANLNLKSGSVLKIEQQNILINNMMLGLSGEFTKDQEKLLCSVKAKNGEGAVSNSVVLSASDGKKLDLSNMEIMGKGSIAPSVSATGTFSTTAKMAGLAKGALRNLIDHAEMQIHSASFALQPAGFSIKIPRIQVLVRQSDIATAVKESIPESINEESEEFNDSGLHRTILSAGTLNIIDNDIGKMKAAMHLWEIHGFNLGYGPNEVAFHVNPKYRVELQTYYLSGTRTVWHSKTFTIPNPFGSDKKVTIPNPAPTIHKDYAWGNAVQHSGKIDWGGSIKLSAPDLPSKLSDMQLRLELLPGQPSISNFPNWIETRIKPGGDSLREYLQKKLRMTKDVSPFASVSGEAKKLGDKIVVNGFSFTPKDKNLILDINLEYKE